MKWPRARMYRKLYIWEVLWQGCIIWRVRPFATYRLWTVPNEIALLATAEVNEGR